MNETELIANLEILVKRYVCDKVVQQYLIKNITPSRTKFILAELDEHKTNEYSKDDLNLIKDIAFYYC